MENSLSNTRKSSSSSVRPRKSIFASQKPQPDNQQPHLLVNGETLISEWQHPKSSTSPNFFTSSPNQQEEIHLGGFVQSKLEPRPTSGSLYVPGHSLSRVIITAPNTQCVRPSSVGKRSVIVNAHQIVQKPVPFFNQFSITPSQPQVLKNSFLIPSQSSNIMTIQTPSLTKTSSLKRKCIIVEGKQHQNVLFRPSPPQPVQIIREIRPEMSRIVIQQNRPEINRIVIQDDPKTISQLNKVSSLNQFLTQQYNLINNELLLLRNKTCQKEFVIQKAFLEKSFNKIDDIFIKQTNQALYRLDEISRCSSSKGFSRSSNSRVKLPTFSNIKVRNNEILQNVFTPIKGVEQMQNSSYFQCNHMDYEHA